MNNQDHKHDCYFYYEEQDMGSKIPTCDYYKTIGRCPCEGCIKYVKKKQVYKIIRALVDDKLELVSRGINFLEEDIYE